ncbi:MAG TPA: hydantoinase/oxoprolinase family protein [Candidatus Binataceae bacterium]|nr:hydantoinase/oxoprolinase family protein [Candidatus Binataceae bacterium]
MGIRVGVDTGGTFTDFIIIDESGWPRVFKTPSIPRAPEQAIINGIEELAKEFKLAVPDFVKNIDLFIHGTTIATNTVIQRSGPKIGIVHTEGFRDILFLRDGFKRDRYNLHSPPPDPFIPRYLRLGVEERVIYTGEVLTPLDEEAVRKAARKLKEDDVQSVAVCLLWSMMNPVHEQRVREIIKDEMPAAHVALSSEILPAIREWPRACATTLSAYVGPVLGRYLTKVENYLRENGYRYNLLIMQLTGGSATVPEIEKRPVLTIGSGPAAGPAAGLFYGSADGEKDLMVIDMGGTSFEVSLISNGTITMSRETEIEQMPIGVAAVDVHSVGAGGGSIAWIDGGGMLRVGPQSAGADPGPACYGHGGENPTVTDANVVLGYLNPDFFLGGRVKLDRSLSEKAIERVAKPLGLDVVETASAIYRVVNANMVGAMRAVSVTRGIDPRGYTVISGGAAGGTHAAKIAEELGISKVICPVAAGALCAFGMLVADVKHSYLTTHPANTGNMDIDKINQIFAEMESRAIEELKAEGFQRGDITLERFVDAKYPYQLHDIMVVVPAGKISAEHVPAMADAFHSHHERLYTYCVRTMSVDMNGWRVMATGKIPKVVPMERPSAKASGNGAEKVKRQVYFDEYRDYIDTPVYDGEKLTQKIQVAGPAVVELPTTTIVVFPGHALTVNSYGDLRIEIPQDEAQPE